MVDAERILIVERRVPGHHFEDENAQRPPIHALVMTLGLDDLGGEVLRSSTQRPGSIHDFLSETKIGNLQTAGVVDEQIFRLQITVCDAIAVQIFECKNDLGGEESGHVELKISKITLLIIFENCNFEMKILTKMKNKSLLNVTN